MNELGSRLRALREEKNLTQEGLAKAADIPYDTYRKYEMGYSMPRTKTLAKLAQVYNLSVDDLLGLNTEPSLTEIFAFELGRITGRSEEYQPTIHRRCKQMVAKYGAVTAARIMIMAEEDPDGFKGLEDHLDITTERLVLKEEYRVLFDEEVLAKARQRLKRYGWIG